MKELPITTRCLPSWQALAHVSQPVAEAGKDFTRVNLLRVLNMSERKNILEVCALDWEASRNPATGKDKRVIRNYFLATLKSDRFVGAVYGRHGLISSQHRQEQCRDGWMAYRADAESSAVFDFEIGRCAPFELRRISDECFA